ncbi:MAG: hypothetical protein K8T89_08145 [Planctomycetes bacterium]|nr:hypothetical protein [Planctomycetota bacterium]
MSSKAANPSIPPVKMDYIAGVLSYLIPGLGQILQGRIAKGVVFFVCLYALFFYGMFLGKWKNVYLPDTAERADRGNPVTRVANDLYNRPHFVGQFFIGAAAWPAIWQYIQFAPNKDEGPFFGKMMRTPPPDKINRLQREESKTWDLGWVYTVIAGVLNILVIYDAIAGPAFREIARKDLELPLKSETATV